VWKSNSLLQKWTSHLDLSRSLTLPHPYLRFCRFELKQLLSLYNGLVEFIEGSPIRQTDLDRVCADRASSFFLLANKEAEVPLHTYCFFHNFQQNSLSALIVAYINMTVVEDFRSFHHTPFCSTSLTSLSSGGPIFQLSCKFYCHGSLMATPN
jgi:hypothetical protein